jgi:hypothetical protein
MQQSVAKQTRRHIDEDVFSWVVIGLIFGGVNLALWATVLWQAID